MHHASSQAKGDKNKPALQRLCAKVDAHFLLPADGHYTHFAVSEDVIEDTYLAGEAGKYFRGLHVPSSRWDELSSFLRARYLPPGDAKSYDALIYIRHSTCLDSTGCVITYAHELQHIVQEARFPKLMIVNSVSDNLWRFKQALTESDLPAEVEANIVSKRVAEAVSGAEAVQKFAEEQVKRMKDENAAEQLVRWQFFLSTPSSMRYDFADRTLELVREYKGRMDFGMDVNATDGGMVRKILTYRNDWVMVGERVGVRNAA